MSASRCVVRVSFLPAGSPVRTSVLHPSRWKLRRLASATRQEGGPHTFVRRWRRCCYEGFSFSWLRSQPVLCLRIMSGEHKVVCSSSYLELLLTLTGPSAPIGRLKEVRGQRETLPVIQSNATALNAVTLALLIAGMS
mmetsp:Transcript_20464/g.68349  ORF Transcript_20464/g.68349 Transcript_20464/m.68349 type:complete len:138 (-) Transcript_20464:10-423(-)